jgi:aromatic amino acid aminotransferase I
MHSSVMFLRKMSLSTLSKAPSVFIDSKTSAIYKNLKVGPMKRLYQYYTPTSVNLAGGVPMDSCFPFESVEVQLPNNDGYKLNRSTTLSINYQRGDGMPVLKEWIKSHTASVHKPPNDFGSCVTVGSTDAISKILTLLECDSLIFDEFAYGHSVITSETLGKKPIGVRMDENGMLPSVLRDSVLKARASGFSANVLYLVPCGHNPTGLTMSLERKQEIYAVCQELDIVIIEDGERVG